MKLSIVTYLKNLKERNALELVMVNLMEAMGLTVLSSPGIGTKQGGVDILAVGKFPGEEIEKVFLLTVKSGDITRSTWEGSPQCLKESLGEIVYSYLRSTLREELRGLPKEICACFGGEVTEPVRQYFNGYIATEEANHPLLNIHFREWNGSEIAGMVERHFLDDRLFVGSGQRLVKRALAMVEEPSATVASFRKFLQVTKTESARESVQKRAVHLSQVSMCLELLFAECEKTGNFEAGYLCAEHAMLWAWDYLGASKGEITVQNQRKPTFAFEILTLQYIGVAQKYFAKIASVSLLRYSFSLACKSNHEVIVNRRAFDVVGRIGEFGSMLLYYKTARERTWDPPDAANKAFSDIESGLKELLKQIIGNNPTLLSPLQDDYVFEFSMAAFYLLQVGELQFLHDWIAGIAQRQKMHFMTRCGYPSVGLMESELYSHVRGSHDEEYREKVLGASALFPMLSYIAATAGFDDCFLQIVELCKKYLSGCNFQMWFPDRTTDQHFYTNDALHGMTLAPILLNSKEELLEQVFRECDNSPFLFSCANNAYHGLIYMGCRCYRYPLPPHLFKAYYERFREGTDKIDEQEVDDS